MKSVARCSGIAWRLLLACSLISISSAAFAQFEFISIAGLERAGRHLKPGEYRLVHPLDKSKSVEIVVDLARQIAGVYQDEQLVAITTVLTGRSGSETPTGVFHILGKSINHRSNLYDASMPFTQKLTDDGVSLHAGAVTGSPGSHGCVHLPARMAQLLYGATRLGTTVMISEGLGSSFFSQSGDRDDNS